jgi:hypothetical protein
MNALFSFRQTLLIIIMMIGWMDSSAQIVDGVLGQRRDVVQVLLRPFRIIDYQKDRVVHNVEPGIHQTVLFENDTCTKFYWAVTPEKMDAFETQLFEKAYFKTESTKYVKDSLELLVRPLSSGKATLFIASISKNLKGKRDASGTIVKEKTIVNVEPMPLLQQAILAEERDTVAKPKKDPKRHWIGGTYSETNILGWQK